MDAGSLTISMPQKLEEMASSLMPELLKPPATSSRKLLAGGALAKAADDLRMMPNEGNKLSEWQKCVQQLTGMLKFPEKVMPILTLPLHRVSCIMARPPPEALDVIEGIAAMAYKHRFDGITYSAGGIGSLPGVGAGTASTINGEPTSSLSAVGDATYARIECETAPAPEYARPVTFPRAGGRDVMGLVVKYNGGAVYHATKTIDAVVESSFFAEMHATTRLGEIVEHAHNIATGLGAPVRGHVVLETDNEANRRIATGEGNAGRAKHLLRRYSAFRKRVARGICRPVFVKDEDNMADFLTKWVPRKKLRTSIDMLTNQRAQRNLASTL